MRKFIAACSLLLTFALLHSARADYNPAPTNVGLYNFSTYTVTTSSNYAILPRNIYRSGMIIQNNGAVSIVIKPGSAPANATDGIVLVAGAILQMNPPPVDALYIESASATAKVIMIENAK